MVRRKTSIWVLHLQLLILTCIYVYKKIGQHLPELAGMMMMMVVKMMMTTKMMVKMMMTTKMMVTSILGSISPRLAGRASCPQGVS